MKKILIGNSVIEHTEFIPTNDSDYNAYGGCKLVKSSRDVTNVVLYIQEQ